MTNPTQVIIRAATLEEAADFADAAGAAFYEAYHETADPANLQRHLAREFGEAIQREQLADPVMTVLAAREPDGAWAGFAALKAGTRGDGVSAERPLEILRFYLRSRWYGRGIAEPLMRTALEHARASGHDVVWLQVWEHNARARRFYEKCGFRAVGTNPFLFGDVREDDVVYEIRLGDAGA